MKIGLDIVSIIIPTKNSAGFLDRCLKHIREQSYPNIEIIIVDGKSTDNVRTLSKKYRCRFYTYLPRVKKGIFDAPHKRNYGAKKAVGKYVYWLDADMELPKNLILEAVSLCKKEADAIILPEDSFGTGIWAKAKQLERRCYWNDSSMESPRFFKKTVWDDIGGFDLSLGAGGDDIDLTQKLLEKNYVIKRAKNVVLHNEGHLSLIKTFKKHFMYGREMLGYFKKRPKSWITSYNPFKPSYLRIFLKDPLNAILFIVFRSSEYLGGLLGFMHSFIEPKEKTVTDYSDYSCQYYDTNIPNLLKEYLKQKYRSLLDAGCGDGALLYALKKNGYFKGRKIYARDISDKSVALVKKIDPKIQVAVDNVETLKTVNTNSADFIISTMVIEHVDDKKILKTIDRVLQKNGIAYLTTIFKKPYAWYFRRQKGRWVMDITHLREYTADQQLLQFIDKKKYSILETKKSLIWFPVADFIIRRFFSKNRQLYAKNIIFKAIRKISIPIIGYYRWEIVLRKNI